MAFRFLGFWLHRGVFGIVVGAGFRCLRLGLGRRLIYKVAKLIETVSMCCGT